MSHYFKHREEIACLDKIFAELEAERNGLPKPIREEFKTKGEILLEQGYPYIVSQARELLKTKFFDNKNRWGEVFAKTVILQNDTYRFTLENQISAKTNEISLYTNCITQIKKYLIDAKRLAKEQDNHHHYKVFTDRVEKLINNLKET